MFLCLEASGQDDGTGAPTRPVLGSVVGRIVFPAEASVSGARQAVLMPPAWARTWDRDVQQRIDTYSSQYRAMLVRDPELFEEISRLARRDAVSSVILQMQGRLGESFRDLVRPIPPEGYFEYSDLPIGEYKVVVLVERGGDPLIWMEAVSLEDSIPIFLEFQDRIQ